LAILTVVVDLINTCHRVLLHNSRKKAAGDISDETIWPIKLTTEVLPYYG
jgi:hypothetical protein